MKTYKTATKEEMIKHIEKYAKVDSEWDFHALLSDMDVILQYWDLYKECLDYVDWLKKWMLIKYWTFSIDYEWEIKKINKSKKTGEITSITVAYQYGTNKVTISSEWYYRLFYKNNAIHSIKHSMKCRSISIKEIKKHLSNIK